MASALVNGRRSVTHQSTTGMYVRATVHLIRRTSQCTARQQMNQIGLGVVAHRETCQANGSSDKFCRVDSWWQLENRKKGSSSGALLICVAGSRAPGCINLYLLVRESMVHKFIQSALAEPSAAFPSLTAVELHFIIVPHGGDFMAFRVRRWVRMKEHHKPCQGLLPDGF